MSLKRTRCCDRVLGEVDDLLRISASRPLWSNESDSDSDDTNVAGLVATCRDHGDAFPPPPTKVPRVSASTSDGPSGSSRPSKSASMASTLPSVGDVTVESLGGDEMDLLRRKDEELADMSLFLAKTVSEMPSQAAVAELVAFLEKSLVERVMLALKRSEAVEAFLNLLCCPRPTAAIRRSLLYLLSEFQAHAAMQALYQSSVVTFLVESLVTGDVADSPHTSAAPRHSSSHWSSPKKRRSQPTAAVTGPSSPPQSDDASATLDRRVRALCPSTATVAGHSCFTTCAALALRLLLALVFDSNSHVSLPAASAFAAPSEFVRAGGLERLVQLVDDEETSAAALALLEVLTASGSLRGEAARLKRMVAPLTGGLQRASTAGQLARLRVLTNLTNLLPSLFTETDSVGVVADYVYGTLTQLASATEVEERGTFALCCAINVVKYEATAAGDHRPAFTRELVAHADFLPILATMMTQRYHRSEAEQLVISGYCATLLGALSLTVLGTNGGNGDNDGGALRVPVMTAVAAASRGTRIGKATDRQPMRMVAAIMQEFLLFQSASGTLTREALLEMDTLVDQIRRQNKIEVTSSAAQECGDDDVAESADEDEEDVTLGDLL